MRASFEREVAAAGLAFGPPDPLPVGEADIAALPAPAQRWLRHVGVVGRPRDRSFVLALRGRFRFGAEKPWMPLEGWQYDLRDGIARIFLMRLRLFGIVPVVGRDLYLNGRGRMLVRPFDRFTVQDATGEALDAGELVTWLNDCVLLAPSMLLQPAVSWREVDDASFEVSVTDGGRQVTGRVFVDEAGTPRDFQTGDRFVARGGRFVRCRWSTPVERWREVDGRLLPEAGRAVWHLPEGDFCYVELDFPPGAIRFDVPPTAAALAQERSAGT